MPAVYNNSNIASGQAFWGFHHHLASKGRERVQYNLRPKGIQGTAFGLSSYVPPPPLWPWITATLWSRERGMISLKLLPVLAGFGTGLWAFGITLSKALVTLSVSSSRSGTKKTKAAE